MKYAAQAGFHSLHRYTIKTYRITLTNILAETTKYAMTEALPIVP